MADLLHTFTINSSVKDVFRGISTPEGLDIWWTKTSNGKAITGTNYQLDFGENYQWEAIVTKSERNKVFELQLTKADAEWKKTRIGFVLKAKNKTTEVSFYHTGWRKKSENYKYSSYCWAMYLRILKRNIEYGEKVPYEKRLKV
jgi:uncharacterized protein YndB with AHSA1/START domain